MAACAVLPLTEINPDINKTLAPEISPDPAACDWDAIAHDYAAGALTVDEICAAHAVTRSMVYYRAKTRGWQLRRARSHAAGRRDEANLTKRLLSALDLKMTQFENRLSEDAAAATAADAERDARTLNTLVRLFEKLKGLGGKGAGPPASTRTAKFAATTAATSSRKDAHDADRLRGELARRLETLRGQLGG